MARSGLEHADLDRATTAFGTPNLDDNFLVRLSHLERLRASLNVPLPSLLSWWADLDTAIYIDHNLASPSRPRSLYDQLFRNRAIIDPPDPAFAEDLANLNGKLSDHVAAICAALNISADDFALLLHDVNVIPLSTIDPPKLNNALNLTNFHEYTAMCLWQRRCIYLFATI